MKQSIQLIIILLLILVLSLITADVEKIVINEGQVTNKWSYITSAGLSSKEVFIIELNNGTLVNCHQLHTTEQVLMKASKKQL